MSQQMREARRALWGERIIGTLYDHKWLALVAALILTGLAGWQASSVGGRRRAGRGRGWGGKAARN